MDEESRLVEEIEKSLKRLRYQHDHWDDVKIKSYTTLYVCLKINITIKKYIYTYNIGYTWVQRNGNFFMERSEQFNIDQKTQI